MTAGAMILGMIPMALGVGEGGEQNAPLARAVIGGLLFATFATLVFVPTMYRLLRRPVGVVFPLLLSTRESPCGRMINCSRTVGRMAGRRHSPLSRWDTRRSPTQGAGQVSTRAFCASNGAEDQDLRSGHRDRPAKRFFAGAFSQGVGESSNFLRGCVEGRLFPPVDVVYASSGAPNPAARPTRRDRGLVRQHALCPGHRLRREMARRHRRPCPPRTDSCVHRDARIGRRASGAAGSELRPRRRR